MTPQPRQATFLGHPAGLYVLFFTEMWERFCYYGMRALLVLYMVKFFKYTQQDASKVYKWYTALVYLTPLLGGYLADRYLGNKWAIIIGAIMMAMGEFMLTQGQEYFFYFGLLFMIFGNGFFKPNMSVQVGRLYPANDPRRDGAYTIFYMGINLGAFLAPLVCGALRDTPGFGFHAGFAAAGVGMLIALTIYLLGLPLIQELPPTAVYQGDADGKKNAGDSDAMTEDQAASAPSAVGGLSSIAPALLMFIGIGLGICGIPLLAAYGMAAAGNSGWLNSISSVVGILNLSADDALAFALGGSFACLMGGWIAGQVGGALRDRVLAILAIGVVVISFWAAFEQAGNAMNVWADQTTNRYLTETPKAPDLYPAEPVDLKAAGLWATLGKAFGKIFQMNPVNTESFQSINAFAIVLLAPIFAWFWVFLAKNKVNLSIAMKVAIGVFLQGMAFALMIWAGKAENGPSSTALTALPAAVVQAQGATHLEFFDAPSLGDDDAFALLKDGKKPSGEPMIAHGGRLLFDPASSKLSMNGVLDEAHRDRMLRATAAGDYVVAVREFVKRTQKAKEESKDGKFEVVQPLTRVPDGFEPRYLRGYKAEEVRYDAEKNSLISTVELADKDYKQILVAGSDPTFRTAINDLFVKGTAFRVSAAWLLWFYVLSTLAELCLSPVGLSMVSKLAPRRFATMLMGMWLLTSFFGNFIAGLAGEKWEELQPISYFTYCTMALLAVAAISFVCTKLITRMMHGVK